MSFLSKVELKYQLEKMGVKVEGNYVKKSDIKKIFANEESLGGSNTKYKITQNKTQYFPLEKLTSETWLKATKSKPKDWVEAWDLSDYDLEISEEEHTNEKGKFNKKSYMNAYESACYSYVNRVVEDWIDEYKHMNFPLTLYRAISVPSDKDIDFKKLGIHWTTREESAQCYDSWKVEKPKESRDFIVKAKVLKTDVNWVGTLAVNINPSFGKDEQEIVLIPGKKIKVLEGGKIKEGIV